MIDKIENKKVIVDLNDIVEKLKYQIPEYTLGLIMEYLNKCEEYK